MTDKISFDEEPPLETLPPLIASQVEVLQLPLVVLLYYPWFFLQLIIFQTFSYLVNTCYTWAKCIPLPNGLPNDIILIDNVINPRRYEFAVYMHRVKNISTLLFYTSVSPRLNYIHQKFHGAVWGPNLWLGACHLTPPPYYRPEYNRSCSSSTSNNGPRIRHTVKKYPYIHGYSVASFPYFNETGSVYICIRKLFHRFTDTDVYGTGFFFR